MTIAFYVQCGALYLREHENPILFSIVSVTQKTILFEKIKTWNELNYTHHEPNNFNFSSSHGFYLSNVAFDSEQENLFAGWPHFLPHVWINVQIKSNIQFSHCIHRIVLMQKKINKNTGKKGTNFIYKTTIKTRKMYPIRAYAYANNELRATSLFWTTRK